MVFNADRAKSARDIRYGRGRATGSPLRQRGSFEVGRRAAYVFVTFLKLLRTGSRVLLQEAISC